MNDLLIYAQVGFNHITNISGFDHILFIMVLGVMYQFSDWKKILWLITAFTLGHSFTLAVATLGWFNYSTALVEFLIPITIFTTCIANFVQIHSSKKHQNDTTRYPMVLVFGLIHGLGFSNYLHSLLGHENSIIRPLFAFNIGLEIGQILVVIIGLGISWFIIRLFKVPKNNWVLMFSGVAAGVALMLIQAKWIF